MERLLSLVLVGRHALYWPQAAGIAFLVAYILYFCVTTTLAHRLHGFSWDGLSARLFLLHAGLGAALLVLAKMVPVAGALAAVTLAAVTGVIGLRLVLVKIGPQGRLPSRLNAIFAAIGWPVRESLE